MKTRETLLKMHSRTTDALFAPLMSTVTYQSESVVTTMRTLPDMPVAESGAEVVGDLRRHEKVGSAGGKGIPTLRGRFGISGGGRCRWFWNEDLIVWRNLPLRDVTWAPSATYSSAGLAAIERSRGGGVSPARSGLGTASPGVLDGGVDSSAAGELVLEGEEVEGC